MEETHYRKWLFSVTSLGLIRQLSLLGRMSMENWSDKTVELL